MNQETNSVFRRCFRATESRFPVGFVIHGSVRISTVLFALRCN
jgi:hypothetical protein